VSRLLARTADPIPFLLAPRILFRVLFADRGVGAAVLQCFPELALPVLVERDAQANDFEDVFALGLSSSGSGVFSLRLRCLLVQVLLLGFRGVRIRHPAPAEQGRYHQCRQQYTPFEQWP
jgi:hypothetical protein